MKYVALYRWLAQGGGNCFAGISCHQLELFPRIRLINCRVLRLIQMMPHGSLIGSVKLVKTDDSQRRMTGGWLILAIEFAACMRKQCHGMSRTKARFTDGDLPMCQPIRDMVGQGSQQRGLPWIQEYSTRDSLVGIVFYKSIINPFPLLSQGLINQCSGIITRSRWVEGSRFRC